MLPDCRKFVFEVVSFNMLLEDIYAPQGLIDYQPQQRQEVFLDRPRKGEKEFV